MFVTHLCSIGNCENCRLYGKPHQCSGTLDCEKCGPKRIEELRASLDREAERKGQEAAATCATCKDKGWVIKTRRVEVSHADYMDQLRYTNNPETHWNQPYRADCACRAA